MGTGATKWIENCCQDAVTEVNRATAFETTINARTLSNWNQEFREQDKFPHPNPYIVNGLKSKPLLFEWFPTSAADSSTFILEHLDHFSVEMLRNELYMNIIPTLLKEADKDGIDPETREYKYLQRYSETPPSYSTVLRWVHYLGFSRDSFHKTYYTDKHEHPENKEHRSGFTSEYLTCLEPCSHRWVQLTQGALKTLQESLPENKKILPKGYTYKHPDTGIDMVELHVDDHPRLQEIANDVNPEFGGSVSVRMPQGAKPVVVFGQDESVYSQNAFNGEQWVGPSGERSLHPKNDGMQKMISALISRVTGFGMKISNEQMKRINEKRERDIYYFDKEAATAVLNTAKKKKLTESPFVRLFEFGGSNGYWTGNHMVVQVEDCIDCLKVIYGSQFDFVFLFDHSSGHAKKRAGGLDVKQMNKGWGGGLLRKTAIKRKEGYLGPFHNPDNPKMVKVGEEQTLVYESVADLQFGPFHLSDDKREEKRLDRSIALDPAKAGMRDKTKSELVDDLMATDYGKAEGKNVMQKKLLRDLKVKASNMNLDTKKMVTHRLDIGWEKKGKGLLQVAYERGFIDESIPLKNYKLKVEDEAGDIVPEYSLVHLIESCHDFVSEVSQLEHVCLSLGCRALITTKYHAEYAGEGIEYCWGYSKALYRKYPLASKKGKENFDKLLAQCISMETITKDL
ncbi:hypothetical protein ACHAXR_003942, partial [Thalassiosira sp. AJA248-18]